MSKKLALFVGLAVVATAAFFILGKNGGAPDQGAQAPQATPVAALKITQQFINFTHALPGRTSAYKVAEIRPQVNGIVIERSFIEGQSVEAGEQLYQIDPAIYEANHASAKAQLLRANANVKSIRARAKRYGQLVEMNAVSKQEYDDIRANLAKAEADVAVAQANVDQVKINLDYTKVYSPISGRIGKSSVTEGALVTANQQEILTKVTQLHPIYVDLTQSSTELTSLRMRLGEGTELPVTLTLEDGRPYEHEGKLQFSDITVDETTGSVQLRALFPNPDRLLLPGMFVRAALDLGKQEVLLVPQRAAQRDSEGNLSVWVVGDDNTVNPRPITAQQAYEDQWIITQGVDAGDVIVLEGFQKIRPGAQVAPTFPEPTPPVSQE